MACGGAATGGAGGSWTVPDEDVLAVAGDRADVLVTISGDLGSTGNVPQIIELVAPRYDALRHGPATGINLLQAYLAVRNADAAQHILDILFALNRPELEVRLHGFSNAVAELMDHGVVQGIPAAPQSAGAAELHHRHFRFSPPINSLAFYPLQAARRFPGLFHSQCANCSRRTQRVRERSRLSRTAHSLSFLARL